jgi:hypothetical protein
MSWCVCRAGARPPLPGGGEASQQGLDQKLMVGVDVVDEADAAQLEGHDPVGCAPQPLGDLGGIAAGDRAGRHGCRHVAGQPAEGRRGVGECCRGWLPARNGPVEHEPVQGRVGLGEGAVAQGGVGQRAERVGITSGGKGGVKFVEAPCQQRVEHAVLAPEAVVDAHRRHTRFCRYPAYGERSGPAALQQPLCSL